MKSNIILLLVIAIFIASVITTFSEFVRCINAVMLALLALAYFSTAHGKELINRVYNNIIK